MTDAVRVSSLLFGLVLDRRLVVDAVVFCFNLHDVVGLVLGTGFL